MRVVAGSAKGRRLVSREGMDTRPTTDRLKESLFAMIQFEVPEARFLDLFAGSGAIGIEALSRGADEAVFVEMHPKAAECIRKNLQVTGFDKKSRLLQQDVFEAIKALATMGKSFDIIFLDPPYEHGFEERVVRHILDTGILAPEGLILVESAARTQVVPVEGRLELEKVKEYKVTKFSFLRAI